MKAKPRNRKVAAGLTRGEKAIVEGKVVTQREARKRLARWLLD